MDGIVLYVSLAFSVLVLLIMIAVLRRKIKSESQESSNVPEEHVRRPVPRGELVRRAGRRVAGSRLSSSAHRGRQAAVAQRNETIEEIDYSGGEDEDDGEHDAPEVTFPSDAKIGVKKRRKLELKAEKRAQREQELEEREEKQRRQALLEEQRKQEEEKARLEEEKRKAEEEKLKEEKKQRELEEYQKLKGSFMVESEGFEGNVGEEEAGNMLKDFIDYIVQTKVVLLEDLAARFKLKTQDTIDRVNVLLETEELTGVIDDRGKFIYISPDELKAIVKFIRQRGRVTISELAECSSSLINMTGSRSSNDTISA